MQRCVYLLMAVLCCYEALLFGSPAEPVARITRFHGEVQVLSQHTPKGNATRVQMGGERYFAEPARLGHELRAGDLVKTSRGARARIIYETGDQLTVAQATSYRLVEEGEQGEKRAVIDLMFGRVRALIRQRAESHEPDLELRTRDMVMGVRGTDFFVSAGSQQGSSQLTVLRGEVAVTDRQGQVKKLDVPAGYILQSQQVEDAPGFQVERAQREQIAEISQFSRVDAPDAEHLSQVSDLAQIERLEKMAQQTLMADIAEHQPELYQKIKAIPASQLENTELIQSISTREVYESAPNAKDSSEKPREFELDPYGEDIYQKYLRYRNQ